MLLQRLRSLAGMRPALHQAPTPPLVPGVTGVIGMDVVESRWENAGAAEIGIRKTRRLPL